MPKKKPDKYDMSTDYQLPPGELWWLAGFWTTTESISILFTSDTAKTWYQANKEAELLIRDWFTDNIEEKRSPFSLLRESVPFPKYQVILWQP